MVVYTPPGGKGGKLAAGVKRPMDSVGQLAKKTKAEAGGAAAGVSVGEVRFETAEAAEAACALDGSSLGGGTITVSMDEKSKDGTKIIIKQIPRSVEWQELKDHFASCGTVAFADVKADLPNVAEIRFETAEEAQQAITVLNGTVLMGSEITVKPHPTSKDGTKLQILGVPPEAAWQELKDAFSQVGTVVFADINNGQKLPPGVKIEGEIRYDDPAHAQIAMTSLNGSLLGGAPIFIELDSKSSDGSKIIVHGILPAIGWQDLKDHFAPVGTVAFAQIHTKAPKGMGKGFSPMMQGFGGLPAFGGFAGFGGKGGKKGPVKKVAGALLGEVRYDHPMHAQMAIAMLNGSVLKGGSIQVDTDWKSNDGTKLWVAGIPPTAGWQDLKDHFASVGRVAFADIKKK